MKGHALQFNHLSKIYWPEDGYSNITNNEDNLDEQFSNSLERDDDDRNEGEDNLDELMRTLTQMILTMILKKITMKMIAK